MLLIASIVNCAKGPTPRPKGQFYCLLLLVLVLVSVLLLFSSSDKNMVNIGEILFLF